MILIFLKPTVDALLLFISLELQLTTQVETTPLLMDSTTVMPRVLVESIAQSLTLWRLTNSLTRLLPMHAMIPGMDIGIATVSMEDSVSKTLLTTGTTKESTTMVQEVNIKLIPPENSMSRSISLSKVDNSNHSTPPTLKTETLSQLVAMTAATTS